MKKLILFFLLIFSISVFSQIPSYYNDVNLNQTGTALKSALATKIVNTHTIYISYTPGVWDALKQTDIDPTNNTKVVLIYGWDDSDSDITNDRTRDKDLHGSGSGVWNREHVYAKSLGNPNLGTSGVGADAHNLRPADAQRNSSRSNRKFGTGSGNSGATASGDWYPGDEWKGDVARILMYMYLHYGNQTLPSGVVVGTVNSTDADMINLLLQWNAEDPVSILEKQRNPVLEIVQGNRNPFIDNPAFATQIWGGPQAEDLFNSGSGDTTAPTIPTSLIASNTTQTSVDLTWTASTDNVAVTGYEIYNGATFVSTTTNTNYTVTSLSSGTPYTFTIKAKDAAANLSSASAGVNITTSGTGGGTGTTTDLLFSEYIEGSSNNKALEIANFTGVTVDLSIYKIKKQTNGAGSWSGGLTLTGQLTNGNVFVVANSNATSTITNVANLITSSSEVTFNGNDAVGLFKNDVLIDILGTFDGGTGNYAQNVTLQRKSSVTSPNTTYTTGEWDSLATDTFSGLGSHSVDGGGSDTTAPTAPTNLTSSNITETSVDLTWTAATDDTAVTGYDIYNGATVVGTVATTSYQVTGLTASTSYTFSVKAKDAAANISASSNTVNATTLTPPDTTAPTAPTNLAASNTTETTVDLNWTAATDNVAVTGYDVYNGAAIIATVATTSYQVTGLTAATSYTFSVIAKDAAGNVSTASNTVNVTTTTSGGNGTTTELLFSEYIEGSSYNKALEIANFTGVTVDLSIYKIKKQTNGAGSWSGGLTLTGQLTNGAVYVVANSSASSTITSVADITTGNAEVTFNGNDAVGLFKNDVLIDIIGTFDGGSSNFAQNVTLQRKSSVSSPNTMYTTSEWDSFASDTFSGLGNHTVDGGSTPDTTAPTTPTNLNASNITETSVDLSWTAATDDTAVTGYDVYNGAAVIATVTATNYQVTGLTAATAYTFSVKATDAAANVSATSNTVNPTTLTPPDTTAPSAPTNLADSNTTQTSVDLTWTAATDNVAVTGYDVYNGASVIATVTATNYQVTSLTEATAYTFSVKAKDAAGNVSPASNTLNVTTTGGNSSTILSQSYFESGWDNWTDGGGDCYRYSGSRSYEGSNSIRIRDNSGTSSAMTSEAYDISTYDTVEVEFYFYSYSMESGEDFWLRYYDGSSWTTVQAYSRGTDFENNGFYSAVVTLDKNSYTFSNNSQFRFQNDASGNADHIYIDEVTITGKTGTLLAKGASKNSVQFLKAMVSNEPHALEDFTIYPNPVSNSIINIKISGTTNTSYQITNTIGQVVLKGKLTTNQIKIDGLKKGIYFLEIVTSEEKMVKKFIKK